jgi:hypothetical protein
MDIVARLCVTKPVLLAKQGRQRHAWKRCYWRRTFGENILLQFQEQEIYWILIMLLPVKPEPVQEEVVLPRFAVVVLMLEI